MKSLKRVLEFQALDTVKGVGVFWVVMLIVDIASYVSVSRFGSSFAGIRISDSMSLSIAGGNVMAMFIFIIVYNYEMYYKYLPISLTFSITRKNFFKSTIMDNLFVISAFSIIQGVLLIVDKYIIEYLGMKPFVNFTFFNTEIDNILFIILSLFLIMIAFNSFMSLLAALNYKTGYKMWIVIGILLILSTSYAKPLNIFGTNLLFSRIDFNGIISIIILTSIIYCINYLIVINTNVKNKIV